MSSEKADSPIQKKWFPWRCETEDSNCRLRLLCFHGAGTDHLIFTAKTQAYAGSSMNSQSTGKNALVDFCESELIQLWALQLPGRGARFSEAYLHDFGEAATQIFDALSQCNFFNGVPFVFLAYSAGCWCAYELMRIIKSRNLPMPLLVILCGAVAPTTPKSQRRWTPVDELDDSGLKEQLRRWGAKENLFDEKIWPVFMPLFRADLAMLDRYLVDPAPEPLGANAVCIYAKDDPTVTRAALENWKPLLATSQHAFKLLEIEGNHGFAHNERFKHAWMRTLVDVLAQLLLDMEHGVN